MAAMFLTRRVAINNISKASSKDHSLCIHSASTISRVCFSSSPKGVNVTNLEDETMRQGLNEAKQLALDVEAAMDANQGRASGERDYGLEIEDKASDTAKKTMDDDAWKAANSQRIRDVTEGIEAQGSSGYSRV